MDGATLKTLTEDIMDDNIDETLFYQVLNIAKTILEEERPWEFLKALDSSISITNGETQTTSRALPSDFGRPYRLHLVDGGSNEDTLEGVPYEDQHHFATTHGYFWLDLANDVFYLSGTQTKDTTLYHYYIKYTAELAELTEPVFPTRFHAILAYRVAGYIMGGMDADNLYMAMSEANRVEARAVEIAMQKWDDQLKSQSMGGSLSNRRPDYKYSSNKLTLE